jgi:hypothetical protein
MFRARAAMSASGSKHIASRNCFTKSLTLLNPDSDRNTDTTIGGVWESDDSQSVTRDECYGLKNGSKPNGEKGCDVVADENAEIREPQRKEAFYEVDEDDLMAAADAHAGEDGSI